MKKVIPFGFICPAATFKKGSGYFFARLLVCSGSKLTCL